MIFHITTRETWDEAARAGEYRGDTLETEGFIHCSEQHQVADVANARFAGRKDLILLCIEPSKVRAEIRYEDATDGQGTFPHIYGPLNLEAVLARVGFQPDESGRFSDPEIAAL
jgi:uncharacterized protein (DUF952 family)